MVIGLQSTGEANTNQTRDEEGDVLDDFVSAPKRILHLFLSKHFPTGDCDMQPHELDLLQHQVSLLQQAALHRTWLSEAGFFVNDLVQPGAGKSTGPSCIA